VRLFYQSLGVTRRSTSGDYAMRLSAILARAALPGTTIELQGLSEGRAVADQYRYLESLLSGFGVVRLGSGRGAKEAWCAGTSRDN
jgi:hypothetical protein